MDEPKIETDLPALIQFGDYWQPGFLIEQNDDENAVVNIPNSDGSEIYIVPIQKLKILKETTISELRASIKISGKGLLACK
ncbi:hypothetical protein [Flavobacterium taihuense]|uniref:Uncharacterized protein n=1 Tax=Flavobacterium taihuense TaxID=2857508 RepID=A0ABS6XUX2_9FLAO|nr:hypothetical protein [Flavobacterium taihuense]MBW4360467.1 hypothetical protein [Flavobacterium taihuense]